MAINNLVIAILLALLAVSCTSEKVSHDHGFSTGLVMPGGRHPTGLIMPPGIDGGIRGGISGAALHTP